MENTVITAFHFVGTRNVNGAVRTVYGTVSRTGNCISHTSVEGMPWYENGLPLVQKKSEVWGLEYAKTTLKLDTIHEISVKEFRKHESEYVSLVSLPSLSEMLNTVKGLQRKAEILNIINSLTRVNQRVTALVKAEGKARIKLLSEAALVASESNLEKEEKAKK